MHTNITKLNTNHVKTTINNLNTNPTHSLKELLPSMIKNHIIDMDYRERFFTPSITIWSLITQVLSDDQSCQSTVAKTIAYLISQGKCPPSANTAAYCKARTRLPERVLTEISHDLAAELEEKSLSSWSWNKKTIKLIDGSTVSMPDTIANQAHYPQSTCQKAGVGFPIARIAAIISYTTGAILEFGIGAFKGKEASELALIRQFLSSFNPGDVAIADSFYANYFMLACLIEAQVDIVFPIHHARKYDFRKGIRLGKKDHIVTWNKPQRPDWMDKQTYDKLPAYLNLREVSIERKSNGFRTRSKILVTTFLNKKKVAQNDLSELYSYRWHVELDLRSIKYVMRMDILRSKTPEMVHKEIWAHVLAYNLIRKIMMQAAIQFDKHPRQLSFKLTLQVIFSFRQANIFCNKYYYILLKIVASKTVANRAGRYEPRRVKRRQKPWDLLLQPRVFYHSRIA